MVNDEKKRRVFWICFKTIPNLPKEVNSSDFFVPKELKLENESDVSGSNAFSTLQHWGRN